MKNIILITLVSFIGTLNAQEKRMLYEDSRYRSDEMELNKTAIFAKLFLNGNHTEGLDEDTLFISEIFILCKENFQRIQEEKRFLEVLIKKYKIIPPKYEYGASLTFFYDKTFTLEETLKRANFKLKRETKISGKKTKIIKITKEEFNFSGNCQ